MSSKAEFKIPEEFEIGAQTIRVVFEYGLLSLAEAYGMYSGSENLVRIDRTIPESHQLEAFCHEVVEAANATYELGLPHPTIQTLGSAFAQMLRTRR